MNACFAAMMSIVQNVVGIRLPRDIQRTLYQTLERETVLNIQRYDKEVFYGAIDNPCVWMDGDDDCL